MYSAPSFRRPVISPCQGCPPRRACCASGQASLSACADHPRQMGCPRSLVPGKTGQGLGGRVAEQDLAVQIGDDDRFAHSLQDGLGAIPLRLQLQGPLGHDLFQSGGTLPNLLVQQGVLQTERQSVRQPSPGKPAGRQRHPAPRAPRASTPKTASPLRKGSASNGMQAAGSALLSGTSCVALRYRPHTRGARLSYRQSAQTFARRHTLFGVSPAHPCA